MPERITVAEAERLTGCRLDRRRAYGLIEAKVHVIHAWSEACSGCHETVEGWCIGCPCNPCHGSGCDECGYQGRKRMQWWEPVLQRDREDLGGSLCDANITERDICCAA